MKLSNSSCKRELDLQFVNPAHPDKLFFLLSSRLVITTVLNERKLSPIHPATELNKVKALQVMAAFCGQFDIQQGGEHGRTALHLAAMHDHEDCAKILVKIQLDYPQGRVS